MANEYVFGSGNPLEGHKWKVTNNYTGLYGVRTKSFMGYPGQKYDKWLESGLTWLEPGDTGILLVSDQTIELLKSAPVLFEEVDQSSAEDFPFHVYVDELS